MVRVTLAGAESGHFEVGADSSLLAGAEKGGSSCIPVGCRGGGCGLCKVRVIEGAYRVKRMSRAHVSEVEAANGYVLACRAYPLTDAVIELAAKDS